MPVRESGNDRLGHLVQGYSANNLPFYYLSEFQTFDEKGMKAVQYISFAVISFPPGCGQFTS